MTGTDLCVNKLQSVLVIFEPPCICMCFAVVGLDYKLYKIHSSYIKIIHNINYFLQNYEIFQALHHTSSF